MMPSFLLVDGDGEVLKRLIHRLEEAGYSAEGADSGRRALRLAREKTPDFLILELDLPDMDGVELWQQIRSLHGEIPVLVLTARPGDADRIRAFEAGCDDYVIKPYLLEELIFRVQAILRRTRPI